MLKELDKTRLSIRVELSEDAPKIDRLLQMAYHQSPCRHNNEDRIISSLREDNAIELALVAHYGSDIIGYVAFSKITVDLKDLGWCAMAPIAVNPKFQGKGLGSRLITTAIDKLFVKGLKGVVVLGELGFYERFGFNDEHGLCVLGRDSRYVLAQSFDDRLPTGDIQFHYGFDQEYDIDIAF